MCRVEIDGAVIRNPFEMVFDVLVASAVASGLATLGFVPFLIRNLRGTSLVGKDLNKAHRPVVPEMGGVAVMLGFSVGVAVITIFGSDTELSDVGPYYYVALNACLGAGLAGLIDDMFGLRRRMKALVPLLMALPLGAVIYAAGDTVLLGVDIGLWMALVVPLGITSAANAANMLEGLNGLGAGLGIIMSVGLIILGFLTQEWRGLFLAIPLLGALVGFLYFNRYPSRVFPGDTMTLFVGATIAAAAIVSHQKTYGALLFIPMIAEFILKARGRFRAENYGRLDSKGRLTHDGPVESLTHLVMRGRPFKEWQVVTVIWALEGAFVASVLAAAYIAGVR